MCKLACPEVFSLSDIDGHAYILQERVPRELEAAVYQAERSCPEGAIEVTA
jgi:ferredoxin